MGWSRRRRGATWAAGLTVLIVLGAAGCASRPAGVHHAPASPGAVTGGVCRSASQTGAGSPLPFSLVDVSAVPGTRQAWVVAGRYGDPFESGNYLLYVS